MDDQIIDVMKGVFPGIRSDVAILVSNPRYMTKRERSWLRDYTVVVGDMVIDFTAYLVTCIDDSQMLTIAKYEVNGQEITYLASLVNGG